MRYCENAATRGFTYAMCSAIARYAACLASETPAILSGVRLDAELGQVDRQAARAARPPCAALSSARRRAAAASRSSRRPCRRHEARARRSSCRRGARSRRRRSSPQDFALYLVQAQHPAQERERGDDVRVAARRGLAEQDVSFALAGVACRPAHAGLVELAVELRRDRLAVACTAARGTAAGWARSRSTTCHRGRRSGGRSRSRGARTPSGSGR